MVEVIDEFEARGEVWQKRRDTAGREYGVKLGDGRKSVAAFRGAQEAQTNAPDSFQWNKRDGTRERAREDTWVPRADSGSPAGWVRDNITTEADRSEIGQAMNDLQNGRADESDTVYLPDSDREIELGDIVRGIDTSGADGLFHYDGD